MKKYNKILDIIEMKVVKKDNQYKLIYRDERLNKYIGSNYYKTLKESIYKMVEQHLRYCWLDSNKHNKLVEEFNKIKGVR